MEGGTQEPEPAGETGPEPDQPAGETVGRRRRRRWLRVLGWTSVGLALALVVAGLGAYLAFRDLDDNIKVLRPDLGRDRPDRVVVPGKRQPINVLVIGSDTRDGQAAGATGATGARSDTTILLHLAADRGRAYGVSIPRDLIVDRPECPSGDGGTVPAARQVMFNTAYAVGREGCTIRTVEEMTGIRIDHFVVVRFDGLVAMADALDGVPVCVPEEINDPRYDIFLREGTYEIKGQEALDYVRARYGIGDGSDIGRMKRQQEFMASMSRKVLSLTTLANPFRLYDFLDSATRAVEVDEDLGSLRRLAKLADEVNGIEPSRIHFFTMPFQSYAPDPNRVAPAPEAREVWRRIRDDEPLTSEQLRESTTAAHDDAPAGTGPEAAVRPADGSADQAQPVLWRTAPADDEARERLAYGLCP